MTGFDLRPRLGEVETPVLLVTGGRDRLVSAAEVRRLAGSIPGSRLEEFEGAGHALFLEEHERFTSLVREFAAGRLGSRARGRAARRA
jgi:pimeloyl-ACP methyl ester carboxylesterase